MAKMLAPGALTPSFQADAVGINPSFSFDSLGGRHVVLLLGGDLTHPLVAPALAVAQRRRALLDDTHALMFTLSCQAGHRNRLAPSLPGIRHFLDPDGAVSTLLGAAEGPNYRPHWLLIDPQLRVIQAFAIAEGEAVFDRLAALLAAPAVDVPAPILVVPRVLPEDLCRHLIGLYAADGGAESGFMRELDGATRLVVDDRYKRRRDVTLEDEALKQTLRARLVTSIVPLVKRAFQFEITRIERYLVACYDAADGGHFKAHRDNTTRGTAHRRFACTINLNADDYDGGDLRFPEYGDRTWRAPTGGAVIFSCGLLHEATPVTRGRRYAFLPFFYDEAAVAIRDANREFIAEEPARRVG